MDEQIKEYISAQQADRRDILSAIHSIILNRDKTVSPQVEPMMGKDIIVYKSSGLMKYGLAGLQNYMSLHVLPIYTFKPLYEKYQMLLPKAKFQKGCINFDKADKMPTAIVEQMITECSLIDLKKIRDEYLKERKLRQAKKQ